MSEEPKQLEPGRELDALVAGKMGLKAVFHYPNNWPYCDCKELMYKVLHGFELVPEYSTDLKAAWQVVEFIHSKAYWTKLLMHYSPDQNYQFMIGDKAGDANGWGWSPADYNAYGDTAPHAICLAFLELEIRQAK